MEIIKVPTQFEERYVAIDGKQWSTQYQCEQYECLLSDPSPLKNLLFYDTNGNPVDIFILKNIPHFTYLILKQDIKHYDSSVVKAIVGSNKDDISFNLPFTAGIWFNDWTNAYNGNCGSNGWRKCPSIKELQSKIKLYQQKIDFCSHLGA